MPRVNNYSSASTVTSHHSSHRSGSKGKSYHTSNSVVSSSSGRSSSLDSYYDSASVSSRKSSKSRSSSGYRKARHERPVMAGTGAGSGVRNHSDKGYGVTGYINYSTR